jgi:hypothetical protein
MGTASVQAEQHGGWPGRRNRNGIWRLACTNGSGQQLAVSICKSLPVLRHEHHPILVINPHDAAGYQFRLRVDEATT